MFRLLKDTGRQTTLTKLHHRVTQADHLIKWVVHDRTELDERRTNDFANLRRKTHKGRGVAKSVKRFCEWFDEGDRLVCGVSGDAGSIIASTTKLHAINMDILDVLRHDEKLLWLLAWRQNSLYGRDEFAEMGDVEHYMNSPRPLIDRFEQHYTTSATAMKKVNSMADEIVEQISELRSHGTAELGEWIGPFHREPGDLSCEDAGWLGEAYAKTAEASQQLTSLMGELGDDLWWMFALNSEPLMAATVVELATGKPLPVKPMPAAEPTSEHTLLNQNNYIAAKLLTR